MSWRKIFSSLLPVCGIAIVLGGFYVLARNMSLRAKGPHSSVANYIVFIEKFDDLSQPEQKASFGFGSTDIIKEATKILSEAVSVCRQYKTDENESYRFDVKILPREERFRVVGILSGADANPNASRCLREKINERHFSEFSKLNAVSEGAYRLVLAVQEARAAE